MPGYLIVARVIERIFNVRERPGQNIIQPSTIHAAYMVVIFGVAIEPLLSATKLNFPYNARLGQSFEVTVDRAQADAWYSFAHHFVNLIGGGVRDHFLDLFQNNLTLMCLSGLPQ